MKKLMGLLVICFAFSLSAFAQHEGHAPGGRPEVGGRENIPDEVRRGSKRRMPQKRIDTLTITQDIPMRRTSIAAGSGLDMIQVAMTFTTILIIPGSTADLLAVSAAATFGILAAEVRAASGLADSTSRSLRTMWGIAMAGCGTRMTS